MFETRRILKVPRDLEIRRLLRKEVRHYVLSEKLLPPVKITILEEHAQKLLLKHNISADYLDFAIVLLGNEAWRKTVAATPFNRRLLLLPQCLKNAQYCKAEIDNLGLICAGCKRCSIHKILEVAERLGYITLVAEGTTIAVGLVEEGSIDAVIGVSCMAVLQKSFEPVSQAAVPAIGLPLMEDGCLNTDLDYDWLYEEMHQFSNDDGLQPISVSLLKNEVEAYFSDEILTEYFPENDSTEKLAYEMMGKGGQRMRPLMTALAYQSYAENVSDDLQKEIAMIIETFHKASLIHDDIEDNDDTRYGQDTLHKTEGIPTALNVGDYLLGKGYQLIANLNLDPKLIAQCLKVVSASHVVSSIGQGADILLGKNIGKLSTNEVLQIFQQKTGEAVKIALLLGAIIGGAPSEDLLQLEKFSEDFGIAYQIRDDLNEFREINDQSHALNFPFLMALLNNQGKNKEKDLKNSIKTIDLELLKKMVNEYKIEDEAKTFLDNYVEDCYQRLDKLQNMRLRLSLYRIMGKIFS